MRTALMVIVASVWLLACGSGSDAATSNHTLTIQNYGTNTTICTGRQFTTLRVTPSGGVATLYDFVSSPSTTVTVGLQLPQTGTYELRVFTAGGQSIYWSDLAMAVGGTTPVSLFTNNVGFYDNSYASGLHSSGNDISCQ